MKIEGSGLKVEGLGIGQEWRCHREKEREREREIEREREKEMRDERKREERERGGRERKERQGRERRERERKQRCTGYRGQAPYPVPSPLTDYFQVNIPGVQYKPVNFSVKPIPVSRNRAGRMSL